MYAIFYKWIWLSFKIVIIFFPSKIGILFQQSWKPHSTVVLLLQSLFDENDVVNTALWTGLYNVLKETEEKFSVHK